MMAPKLVCNCGVSQGTILGPRSFFYIKMDRPNCLYHMQSRMQANYTSITFASDLRNKQMRQFRWR